MGSAGDGGTPMADETRRDFTSPWKASSSRTVSKKAAARIAAAKAYVVAMKKAGEEVPEWVQELAKQRS